MSNIRKLNKIKNKETIKQTHNFYAVPPSMTADFAAEVL